MAKRRRFANNTIKSESISFISLRKAFKVFSVIGPHSQRQKKTSQLGGLSIRNHAQTGKPLHLKKKLKKK